MMWLSLGIICLFVVPLCWLTNSTFRYYVKMTLYNVWIMFSASLIVPLAALTPRDVNNVRYIQWLWRKTLTVFGLQLEIKNKENLQCNRPYVIVCNHQSSLDVIAMMEVMPSRTTAWVKKELIYAGPFGLACWLCGLLFVDRSNREKAHKTMEETAKIMHKESVNIWIYPEGTRNSDGNLLTFKKGAFFLAIQAQVQILPIVFSSYQDFLSKKRKIFNKGKVIISCLPAISTQGLTVDDVSSLTNQVQTAMTTVFEATSKELHDEAVLSGRSIMIEKTADTGKTSLNSH